MVSSRIRITWIDWAKTLFIALVCVGHFNIPETQKVLIFGCHVPAFFIISGFLYHRHDALRTLFSFAVPMLFYTAIVFGLHIAQDVIQNGYWDYRLDLGHLWHRVFEQFFFRNGNNPYGVIPITGVWFVVALLVCRFLAGDIKLFSFVLRYRYISLLILIIWLTIEPMIWDYISIKDYKFYYGLYAMPFFLFGNILRNINFRIESLNPIFIVIATINYLIVTLNYPRFNMVTYQYGPTYLLFFVNALCGCMVVFWLSSKLPKTHCVKVFSIGTLFILVLHTSLGYFVLPLLNRLGLMSIDVLKYNVMPWFEMILVLFALYYPISWLYKYYPILLGKLSNK